MKMYNNGQRPTKMYGGGMAMRKPMQVGNIGMKKPMQQPQMGMTGMVGTGQMSGMRKGGKTYQT
tara:strand:+ start:196 stop:387 length:192 start_codon:yes stop_codon:yes gene_type:complete